MEKKKVTVFVAGQKLNLITTESEKYVTDIAQKVDTAVNSMFASSNMSREKCAVMAALDFCDDEAKARIALNELKEQIKDYIEDSLKLRTENEELKAEIEKLKAEKQELLNSKKTLVASAVEIKKEKTVKQEIEVEIDSSDDLSFDFDEVNTEGTQADEAVKAVETNDTATPKKADKKRHNHSHTNPYKERFLKQQNEQKGYTPTRQYSLFDD